MCDKPRPFSFHRLPHLQPLLHGILPIPHFPATFSSLPSISTRYAVWAEILLASLAVFLDIRKKSSFHSSCWRRHQRSKRSLLWDQEVQGENKNRRKLSSDRLNAQGKPPKRGISMTFTNLLQLYVCQYALCPTPFNFQVLLLFHLLVVLQF